MLPISSQPVEIIPGMTDAQGSFYRYKAKTKQAKPYNVAAPYLLDSVFTHLAFQVGYRHFGGQAAAGSTNGYPYYYGLCEKDMLNRYFDTERQQSVNTAMARFVSQVSQSAYVAVNLAEREQTLNAGTKRMLQLIRFVKKLKQGKLVDAAKELNISGDPRTEEIIRKGKTGRSFPKNRKKRRFKRTKDWANTFLEFHFGWVPLMKDIYTFVDNLQSPPPLGLVEVKGKRIPTKLKLKRDYNPSTVDEGYDLWYKGSVRTKISAHVKVSSTNLFLANEMGITNPATFVLELTKMSFIADWFFNLQQFLSQETDLLGVDVSNVSVTTSHAADSSLFRYYGPPYGYHMKIVKSSFRLERKTGLPSITLTRQYYPQLSVLRGLTAASLLAQLLGREKRTKRIPLI